MDTKDRVQVDTSDHLAEVTMNRPDKHNGLDHAMFEALGAAADRLGADPTIQAIVLAGAGPSFCAGLDFASFMSEGRPIEEMLARPEGRPSNFAQHAAAGWGMAPQPVIAAVHGNCLGGGAQIALACDLRIAAADLRLSVLEIKWGLIPDMGITRSLPRLVGIDRAKELTWTGRVLDAAEALELGLVTEVVDDPVERARELGREIAAKSPDAIRRAKHLYDAAWCAEASDSLALEEELQRQLLNSPNQVEAVKAAMAGEEAQFAPSDFSG